MLQLRRTALFAFCIFFTVLGLSQTSEWQEYAYTEDGFAISAPLKPWILENTRQPEDAIVGHSYLFPLTKQEQDGSAYRFLLAATRRRDSDQRTPEQALKEAKDIYASYLGTSFKYASPATVVYEKPISIGKYPGIEFEMQHENLRYLGRFYVVDRRMYSLTVGTQTQVPFPEEMQRWYSSFRITEPKESSKTM